MKGALAKILSNEEIRKELIAGMVAMVIPILVQRGYITSSDAVNADKVAGDLVRLFKEGQ